MSAKIFIDGEAGTTGLQIRERLQPRNDIELIQLSDELRKETGARAEALNSADVAILCLPDEAARQAVALIEGTSTKVIDASTAHRAADGWTYGFGEMTWDQAKTIAGSQFVSNPGCYPTGTIAMVRPLIEAGLLPANLPLTVNAISGYSGGGRQMIEAYEDKTNPVTNPYAPYGLGFEHKHVNEMQIHGLLEHQPLFQPIVGPHRQGMIVSIPLQLWALETDITGKSIHDCLAERYRNTQFVSVAELWGPTKQAKLDPREFNDSNHLKIHIFANDNSRQMVMSAVYDNLGKGASGAAIQNLNLLLGCDEGLGLRNS